MFASCLIIPFNAYPELIVVLLGLLEVTDVFDGGLLTTENYTTTNELGRMVFKVGFKTLGLGCQEM